MDVGGGGLAWKFGIKRQVNSGPPETCCLGSWVWDRAGSHGQVAVTGSCSCALMLSCFRDRKLGPWLRVKHKLPDRPALHQEMSDFSVCRDLDRQAGPQAFTVRQCKKWGLARWSLQLAEDAPNRSRHPGGPAHQLSTRTAWLPDSQANSSCISETKRHAVGIVQGMVGVEIEGLREAKKKELVHCGP